MSFIIEVKNWAATPTIALTMQIITLEFFIPIVWIIKRGGSFWIVMSAIKGAHLRIFPTLMNQLWQGGIPSLKIIAIIMIWSLDIITLLTIWLFFMFIIIIPISRIIEAIVWLRK